MTNTRMYLACTRCKRGDNGALFIRSLSQFLEVQLAKGLWLLCTGLGKKVKLFRPHSTSAEATSKASIYSPMFYIFLLIRFCQHLGVIQPPHLQQT